MASLLVDYEDSDEEQEHTPTRNEAKQNNRNDEKNKTSSGVVSFAIPALLQQRKRKKEDDSEEEEEEEDRKKRQDVAPTSLTKLLPPPKNPNSSTSSSQQREQQSTPALKTAKQNPTISIASKLQVQINARKQQQLQLVQQQEREVGAAQTEESSEGSHGDDIEYYYPQMASTESEAQSTTSSYFEPSPDFLPKHKRDSFHFQEGAKVIEVNQAELRKGTAKSSQPVIHTPSSFSNMPNYQFNKNQKRKHQITYLAFEAAQRETELAEQRAASARSKQQVRSKYGW